MTLRLATAEEGSNGADVPASGVWDTGSLISGGTFRYSNTGGCKRGNLVYSWTVGAIAGTSRRGWNVNAGNTSTAQWVRGYIDPADFTGGSIVARGMDSLGTTQRWRISLISGTLSFRRADNNTAASGAAAFALSNGTRYRFAVKYEGSTTGVGRLIVYVGDSTTPAFDSGDFTDNFGGTIQTVFIGQATSGSNLSGRIDDFAHSDAGEPPPSTITATLSGSGESSSTLTGTRVGTAGIGSSAQAGAALTGTRVGTSTLTASGQAGSAMTAVRIVSGTLAASELTDASLAGTRAVSASLAASALTDTILAGVRQVVVPLSASGQTTATAAGVREAAGTLSASGLSSAILTPGADITVRRSTVPTVRRSTVPTSRRS